MEWSTQGVALLPLGGRFAAVRIAADLVHAAVGSEESDKVARALAETLHGPVIQDYRAVGATYYALINWHAGLIRAYDEGAPCLGLGVYLGVPRIDRRGPPGSYWAVAPRYDGDLCTPGAVTALVESGRQRLAESDQF